MVNDPASYTWHEGERKFRDKFGRFVARTEVRASLDRYIDVLKEEAGSYTQALADQSLSISQWQLKMESLIKRGHVAAAAIAAGGHAQAKPSHWGEAGAEIRFQYDRLNRFAKQLEDGRPVHGGTIARAQMYAIAPTTTYERILRKDDLKAGFDLEKRILHSEDSCERCLYYASLGWQQAGTLPDIGTQSQCLSRCRCTFERKRSAEARKRRGMFSTLWEFATKKRGKRIKGGSGKSKKSGKSNVGCGTGAGGFAKGNRCNRGGGGTGEKPGGPVSHKARKDGEKEEWTQYKTDKNGKFPDPKNLETERKSGLPAKINVEKGPPRDKREEKALEKAEKAGKEAIVRTSVKSAWTRKTDKSKEFMHGDERIATVMLTKDIDSVKPTINGKPYDPANFESVRGSKYTVVAESVSTTGGLVSGHNRKGYAEKVARSHVKAERDEWSKEKEMKLVKDHTKDNLVKDTVLGREPKSVLTIRVLTRAEKGSKAEDLSMKKQVLTNDKCERRSRIAALRDGVEAFPVKLYPSGMQPSFDDRLKFALGELPGHTEAVEMILERLNASGVSGGTGHSLCPKERSKQSGKKLTADDLYIHYLEAANSNYIGDRYMFLDGSTLKNLAKSGADGIAFMNSHRTGGLSAPAELPFGRTFAGRYEEHSQPDGSLYKRALLGVYMIRWQYPNGILQPSTDDLHNAIDNRVITDVSIGLGNAGDTVCDVCARPLSDKDCNHVPGTTENMNPEQIESQLARGVPGGKASYSVVNGVTLEVSAVYKGAVPGAGFRKAMKFGRSTGGKAASDILAAYGSLMDDGDKKVFSSPINKGSKAMGFDFLSWLKLGQSVGAIDATADLSTLENVQVAPAPAKAPVAAPAPTESLAVSGDERAEFEKQKRELQRDKFGVQADAFVLQLKTANKITPAEEPDVKRSYVLAAMDDHFNPLPDEDGKPVSRLSVFKAAQLGRVDHGLTSEQISTAEVLPNGEIPDDSKGTPAERLAALLKGTPFGQEVAEELVAKLKVK